MTLSPHSRIIDIGTGPDGIINFLTSDELFGLDPLMHHYFTTFSMSSKVQWLEGVVDNMPFFDGYFDLVISTNTLDHVSNPFGALVELKRILKPNGMLALSVDCYGPIRRGIRNAKERIGFGDPPHPFSLSLGEIKDLFDEAGFKILDHKAGRGTMGAVFHNFTSDTQTSDRKGILDEIVEWLDKKLTGYSRLDYLFIANSGSRYQ